MLTIVIAKPALDVEATVSPSTGALSVGVFGPVDLVDVEEAERLVQSLKQALCEVAHGDR